MGRPRRTSENVSSPRPAATVPKAAPAAPPPSASSKSSSTNRRTSTTSAAKGEGGQQRGKQATSPRGTGQSYQTRSTTAYSGDQGDGRNGRGARAKTPTAAGGTRSPPEAAGFPSGSPQQAAPKTQSKSAQTRGTSSHLPSPLPTEKVAEIERETRGQRTNPEWYKWRENRITASVAPKIINSRFANGRSSEVPQSYLKAVTQSGSGVQTCAMSWGVQNEKKAVEAYKALKSREADRAVKVDDCGLYVDKSKSWLAASPDGIVKEAQTGKELGVLEVKCPYKHRDKTVSEACKDKTFCLEKKGDSYALKKTHPYYAQVQCQMGVTGLDKADFVVYTNKETAIAPVRFDPVFWEKAVPKLEKFYTEAVVPHLQGEKSAAVWAKEE